MEHQTKMLYKSRRKRIKLREKISSHLIRNAKLLTLIVYNQLAHCENETSLIKFLSSTHKKVDAICKNSIQLLYVGTSLLLNKILDVLRRNNYWSTLNNTG